MEIQRHLEALPLLAVADFVAPQGLELAALLESLDSPHLSHPAGLHHLLANLPVPLVNQPAVVDLDLVSACPAVLFSEDRLHSGSNQILLYLDLSSNQSHLSSEISPQRPSDRQRLRREHQVAEAFLVSHHQPLSSVHQHPHRLEEGLLAAVEAYLPSRALLDCLAFKVLEDSVAKLPRLAASSAVSPRGHLSLANNHLAVFLVDLASLLLSQVLPPCFKFRLSRNLSSVLSSHKCLEESPLVQCLLHSSSHLASDWDIL